MKTFSSKGLKWIYNPELKKNIYLKPNEELPEGWFYGQKKFSDDAPTPITKKSRWIFNRELKQNKFLKPGEILPEGWEYGQKRSWD